MKHQKIHSIEELKQLNRPISITNIQHNEKLSKLDKLALLITSKVGSMGFFLIIFC